MVKKGDTLIEVCIAIGIFSLIAIGVASVMSSGTAGSETALETTLAREEIDAQADAIRFVHESYISAKNSSADPSNDPYYKLWKKITGTNTERGNAIDASNNVTQYNPSTCANLYNKDADDGIFKQRAFILNNRELSNPDNALVSTTDSTVSNKFEPTSTYPRLVYKNSDNLTDKASSTELNSIEGIYVVAVKDGGTNMIVEGTTPTSTLSYYDFYIRSCWYGLDAERPTTISTVIRLYDPPASQSTPPADVKYVRFLYNNTNSSLPPPVLPYTSTEIKAGETKKLADPNNDSNYRKYQFRFQCWGTNTSDCSGENYSSGFAYSAPATLTANRFVPLYAIWDTAPFTITFNTGDGEFPDGTKTKTESCAAFDESCEYNYAIPSKYLDQDLGQTPTRSGFYFAGWSTEPGATTAQYDKSSPRLGQLKESVNLYAVWSEQNETITIRADWTSNTDYDSYMQLSIPGSNSYQSASWGTRSIDVNYMGRTINLIKGAGDGRGHYNGRYSENFEINTLGGKNYYYSVHNWSTPKYIGDDITITVSGPYMGTKVFKSTTRTDCNYWNVFAYKNGRIVERNTCSNSMEYDY